MAIDKLQTFDNMLNAVVINLYTISKEDGIIKLANFNLKNKKHYILLNSAIFMSQSMERQIHIGVSFWQYIKIRLKWPNFYIKRVKNLKDFDCTDFMEHIEQANNYPNAFLEIYDLYYDRKKI